jgi:molybdopterin-containing oxidoreductase family membrane subunit
MPLIVIAIPRLRTINMITITAVVVIIALWFNRYLIVVPTLESPYIPIQDARPDWVHYSGTWVEWVLTLGGIASFCLLFTIATRFVPVIQVSEEEHEPGRKNYNVQENTA